MKIIEYLKKHIAESIVVVLLAAIGTCLGKILSPLWNPLQKSIVPLINIEQLLWLCLLLIVLNTLTFLILLSKNEEWKEKRLRRQAWEKTKSDYSKYHPTPGVTVYISKEPAQPAENVEWYCNHCADIEMIQSTLQMVHHSAAGKEYQCHKCKFAFRIPPE